MPSRAELLRELRLRVGDAAVLDAPPAELLTDQRGLYQGAVAAVVAPQSTAQVASLLAYCHEQRISVVPQGGNTGYCGGATPDASGSQLLLLLSGLKAIRAVDPDNYSLTAEAGCILATIKQAAAAAQRYFPLALGSEGSCQLGGNLSTNAGGLNVLRYGMTRDLVLGLEVVLADGRVLDTLRALRKDNTGYDIKSLFIGAEGTLGVITAATLKLLPQPLASATAFVAIPSPAQAVALLARLRAVSGERVASFELIPRIAIELTTRLIAGVADPLDDSSPWYLLVELTSSAADEQLNACLDQALEAAMNAGEISNASVAQNERQRSDFWRLRESIPAAQRRAGASLKHDVSLPITALPRFVAVASAWVAQHVPEGYLVAYGHVGDGNLHFNINASGAGEALLRREAEIKRVIHDLVHEMHGSFSAEHGIGQLKLEELERYTDPVELELMRTLKQAFDPRGILNPGKVLRNAK
mgnify:CR=1 FL=1